MGIQKITGQTLGHHSAFGHTIRLLHQTMQQARHYINSCDKNSLVLALQRWAPNRHHRHILVDSEKCASQPTMNRAQHHVAQSPRSHNANTLDKNDNGWPSKD